MQETLLVILILFALPTFISISSLLWALVLRRSDMALQILLSWDQGINVYIYAKHEGFGKADETLSARAWRRKDFPRWRTFRKLVDLIFFWDKDENGNRAHCHLSWLSEVERKHLHPSYHEADLIALQNLAAAIEQPVEEEESERIT